MDGLGNFERGYKILLCVILKAKMTKHSPLQFLYIASIFPKCHKFYRKQTPGSFPPQDIEDQSSIVLRLEEAKGLKSSERHWEKLKHGQFHEPGSG